jgi:hypothetical protein
VATLYDSAFPGEIFVGYSSYSALYHLASDNVTADEYDFVSGFSTVNAYSFVGRFDYALIYDAVRNHAFGFLPFGNVTA